MIKREPGRLILITEKNEEGDTTLNAVRMISTNTVVDKDNPDDTFEQERSYVIQLSDMTSAEKRFWRSVLSKGNALTDKYHPINRG